MTQVSADHSCRAVEAGRRGEMMEVLGRAIRRRGEMMSWPVSWSYVKEGEKWWSVQTTSNYLDRYLIL